MAFVLADRVKESSVTTGTGQLTLGGAAAGFQSFLTGIGVGNECFYAIVGQGTNQWEVGIGIVSSATTLDRNAILGCSGGDYLPVNFSAGIKDVFCTHPAGAAAIGGPGLLMHKSLIDSSFAILSGHNAISAGPVTVANGVTVTVPTGSTWSIV